MLACGNGLGRCVQSPANEWARATQLAVGHFHHPEGAREKRMIGRASSGSATQKNRQGDEGFHA